MRWGSVGVPLFSGMRPGLETEQPPLQDEHCTTEHLMTHTLLSHVPYLAVILAQLSLDRNSVHTRILWDVLWRGSYWIFLAMILMFLNISYLCVVLDQGGAGPAVLKEEQCPYHAPLPCSLSRGGPDFPGMFLHENIVLPGDIPAPFGRQDRGKWLSIPYELKLAALYLKHFN